MTPEQGALAAIRFIEELKKNIGIPMLSDTEFDPKDAVILAENAMEDTGMPENPRQPTIPEVVQVFREAYLDKR